MISIAHKSRRFRVAKRYHRQFLQMLPMIGRLARRAFRHAGDELREELVAETIANAFVAFARLVERGKADLAYATPLTQFAIRQIRVGRRVGGQLNCRDVASHYCHVSKDVRLERLDRFDREQGCWLEIVVESRHAGPAEVVATRLDFAAWLRSLTRRRWQIATALANGQTTSDVARRFGLTAGRISQVRAELRQAWAMFVGEPINPQPCA